MKELFDCQKEVLAEVEDRKTCALYCAPGTGKTLMGLEKIRSVGSPHNLIVCQKSKIDDWIADAQEQFPDAEIVNLTKGKVPSQPTGFMGVINYDLIWRRKEFLDWRGYNLTLDESSRLQNPTSKRSKFVLKMRQDSVQLLSGTPISGKYEKLYTQMQLLGYKRSWYSFFNDYCEYWEMDIPGTTRKAKIVCGYKNVPKLKRELKELGCVFRRLEEMVDLPESITIPIYVDPPKGYKKFMKDRIVEIDGETFVGDTGLTMMLRARQICSYMNKEKKKVLSDLLDTLENERVVIFYQFERDLECIKSIAENLNRPFSQINGAVKDRKAFRENENGIIAVQFQAGAQGENLQEAHYLIYWSLCWPPDDWEQSHDRIRRIGQKEKQVYYEILTRDSIEMYIRKCLDMKMEYTLELFRKDYKELFHEDLN